MPIFFTTDESNDWRLRFERALGAYEIIGGTWGIFALLRVAPVVSHAVVVGVDHAGMMLWTAAAVLFLVLAMAGVLTISGHRAGLRLSIVSQVLQLFWVSAGGWTFVFSGGLFAGAVLQDMTIRASYGWSVHVEVGTNSAGFFLGANVVPAAMLMFLAMRRRQIANDGDSRSAPS